MDNYIVRKYSQHNLSLIKRDWQLLEKGRDMSYFQTYDWYESINDIKPNKGEVVFIEVLDNKKPLLIAPLWILRHSHLLVNRRGCYFWGKDGYSDYLNFVYLDFDETALLTLFSFIRKEYGITQYYLEFLQERTDIVAYIDSHMPLVQKDSFSYAALYLPKNVESYSSNLSKHTRQNLRTAHNRMIKDGLSFEYIIIEKCDNIFVRQKCDAIKMQRLPFKRKRESGKWSFKTKIHIYVDKKLRIKFPYKSVLDADKNGNLLLITCGDDVAAFFYYGYEVQNNRIVVMTAGTNVKYARYSPGFYFMYQQIRNWIGSETVKIVDFTRGGEKYKYDLGCENVPVCNLSFELKKE